MTSSRQSGVLSDELIARLQQVEILASLNPATMHCLDGSARLTLAPGDALVTAGSRVNNFWILLEGAARVAKPREDGSEATMYTIPEGEAFGEVGLLANIASPVSIYALTSCELLVLDQDQFWSLMNACPEVRRAVLGNMAVRMQNMQAAIFHQEKMAALGTMSAGLMHELNNPGAAARRASSQLRENLSRMHQLTSKFARAEMTPAAKLCMMDLQEFALSTKETRPLSSMEQSDAEERLAEWMEQAEVEDAWRLAPTLIAMGIDADHLACARSAFTGETFNDALHWLEALVSSMQLVGIIEESIGRVSELVMAVKSYAYDGRGQRQMIDINKSLHATLVILGHKLREKQIVVEKSFSPNLPTLETDCQGLSQVWTNLLDNAIDASPVEGHISVRTWADDRSDDSAPHICIEVCDHGSGIPLESQPHIFDPFYTTKPSGVGTGLGLGITSKIVSQFGGTIHFSSEPGETEFVVRIPGHRG